MWRRVSNLILLLSIIPGLAWAASEQTERQQWQGTVELAKTVHVELGKVLEIAPGTRVKVANKDAKLMVRGRLLVLGSETAPVTFDSPKGWQGIEFVEAEAGSRIEHAHFKDCRRAIGLLATSPTLRNNRFENCSVAVDLLRESKALLENNHFNQNDFGLKISMRSLPQVINNYFKGHRQAGFEASNSSGGMIVGNEFIDNNVGLSLQRTFSGEIRDNRFVTNKVGLNSYQTRNTPLVEGNLFRDNEVAFSSFTFSYPALRNNRFIDNKTALRNDQFGSALVEKNLFRGNETAIYNNRKSNPRVLNNQFEKNQLVLFVDYSSYPEVRQNNFVSNSRVAELGIYQSSDWEQRVGSKKLVRQQAMARKSRNPLLEQAPTEFSDRVDLSSNWWGDDTVRLAEAGADANLELLYDRRDKPQVSYPDYGAESYQLDLIIYSPWLEQPVGTAGPQELP